jgi:hypothetical protein
MSGSPPEDSMRIPYPNARKALARIMRNDHEGYVRYRAQLRYRHYRQRYILGMTNAHSVVDEVHNWPVPECVPDLQARVSAMVDRVDFARRYGVMPPATTPIDALPST